jgi:hypothetical protein
LALSSPVPFTLEKSITGIAMEAMENTRSEKERETGGERRVFRV